MKETLLKIFSSKVDEVIAFISGDILATYLTVSFLPGLDWIHPLLKLIIALFVGIFGGIGGLIGKDLYTWARKKIK